MSTACTIGKFSSSLGGKDCKFVMRRMESPLMPLSSFGRFLSLVSCSSSISDSESSKRGVETAGDDRFISDERSFLTAFFGPLSPGREGVRLLDCERTWPFVGLPLPLTWYEEGG